MKRQFLFSHSEEFSTVGQALWCKYMHCDPFGHPSLPIFFHPRQGCGCGFGHLLPLDCPDNPNSQVPWTSFLHIFAVVDLVIPSPVPPMAHLGVLEFVELVVVPHMEGSAVAGSVVEDHLVVCSTLVVG